MAFFKALFKQKQEYTITDELLLLLPKDEVNKLTPILDESN